MNELKDIVRLTWQTGYGENEDEDRLEVRGFGDGNYYHEQGVGALDKERQYLTGAGYKQVYTLPKDNVWDGCEVWVKE